jgi:20S proteasome subunit alpha 1
MSIIASQEKLVDPISITHIFQISPSIGCVMAGSVPDARALVTRARSEAAEFHRTNGYEMPCNALSQRLANINQVYTQRVRIFSPPRLDQPRYC